MPSDRLRSIVPMFGGGTRYVETLDAVLEFVGAHQPTSDELADAVENRDADYGIIVFGCELYIPDKVGYFHEYDSERFSVALKETEDDDVELGFLRIAYNWARTRAVQGYVDSGTASIRRRFRTL